MIFGSVCSGIESASVAWHPLGWRAAFLSEIDPFARAVLAQRFPGVPLHGDFTTIEPGAYEPIDVLVGGTPCQDFSVAGLRAGLAGDRGNLSLEFIRLAGRLRPRWIVWENVPGVLSQDGGRAFGAVLGGLGELGYGFAYRVLDARFFGLAQRRARVFVVGCLGDWRGAAAVLFEREGLQGDSAPRVEAWENLARPLGSCAPGGSGYRLDADTADNLVAGALAASTGGSDENDARDGRLIPLGMGADGELARALNGCHTASGRFNYAVDTYVAQGFVPDLADPLCANEQRTYTHEGANNFRTRNVVAFSCKDSGQDTGELSPTLRAMNEVDGHANAGGQVAIAFDTTQITHPANRSNPQPGDPCHPLAAGAHPPAVAFGGQAGVRRLTPVECARLQGFPDDWLDVEYRGKPAADGNKYRALGNSMAVPVMNWLGQRIELVEELLAETSLLRARGAAD